MTKADIFEKVSEKTGISQKESADSMPDPPRFTAG